MELVLKLAQGARIGSLIMDNHGTMNIDNRMSDEDSAKKQAPQDVPERLATETARETMVLLVDAGLLSADWQPGLMATRISSRLPGRIKTTRRRLPRARSVAVRPTRTARRTTRCASSCA